ncbi:adenine phosphoribosyltransferase [Yinghuangia seranimata]|uniref:adenine phosphoribosyltransferase n=1 Tax=Yinghuangia seranimata TaxID=408067 RepID=UPI00248AB641|nr:adenine phosphoribosyltransferase [Yinghuangia seranimata]MDI2132718.1 adenine phosphoribosyltransferase [Yinghuangia seranimata]
MTRTPVELSDLLQSRIRDIADWPKPGVVFKDISPLLADPEAFAALVDALAARCAEAGVTKVVGIEARGFILAAPVAYRAGAGFVPVRKQGKLPCATYDESYDLEYGSATLEVHQDAFAPGERVLVIDDVLATGGTVAATIALIRRAGAEVAGVSVLLELGFLDGRAKLTPLIEDGSIASFILV